MKPPSRSAAIDAVRVLSIVAVVVGHVALDPLVRAFLYPWHVPVFFVLTGYLWRPGRTLRTEFRGRLRTLGRPYAAWLAVIAAPYLAYLLVTGRAGTAAETAVHVVVGAGLGRPFSAFWFVAALLWVALIVRALERAPLALSWAVAVAGVVLAYVAGDQLAALPLAVGVALPAVVFVLAGQVLQRHRHQVTRPGATGAALLVVGAIASSPLDLKAADLGTPVVGVLAAVLLSAGLILAAEATVHTSPLVVRMASSGLAVVLVHAAVLWVLVEFVTLPTWLLAVVVLVVSWVIADVAGRSRASAWLTGRERMRA